MRSLALSTRRPFFSLSRDALGIAAAGILLAAVLLDPTNAPGRLSLLGQALPSTCAFHLVTGAPCPSCGLTRSVTLTIHGSGRQAFLMHPIGPFIALAAFLQFAFSLLSWIVPQVRAWRPSPTVIGWSYLALFITSIAMGVLRLFHLFPWPPY